MIIKNNLIPFKGYSMLTIFPFIFIRKDWLKAMKEFNPETWQCVLDQKLNRENIRFAQQIEMFVVGCGFVLGNWFVSGFTWVVLPVPFILFYVLYGLSWLWHLSKVKFEDPKQAYKNICFEREARLNEYNMTYLKDRKLFGWIRFIKKKPISKAPLIKSKPGEQWRKGKLKGVTSNNPRYDLWKFFNDEHDLTLLEGQLDDIIMEVQEYLKSEE